jgi:hypothetical protein
LCQIRLQQLARSINKTTVKRIELLAGWVPPHDAKRIVAIIGLPWNGAKVRILVDPGLRPKGRIVWTITKISVVYFSFLQGWKINSNEVCENCSNLSIKWTKRY